MNKIGICSDHAGYEVKELIKKQLTDRGLEVVDFGCPSAERCDYPDYAHPMGQAIEAGDLSRGISVCGSGNGISMVMNKYPKVRAALCWDVELAKLASGSYPHGLPRHRLRRWSSRSSCSEDSYSSLVT